jgi:hypothetical protein
LPDLAGRALQGEAADIRLDEGYRQKDETELRAIADAMTDLLRV